jgi:Skp family chaperone for outer membrane proteins
LNRHNAFVRMLPLIIVFVLVTQASTRVAFADTQSLFSTFRRPRVKITLMAAEITRTG